MANSSNDTIVALATGALPSALAIVRISGSGSHAAVRALSRQDLPAMREARLRRLYDSAGDVIDDAVVSLFPAGASFTGEQSAELTLHGGPGVVSHALEALTGLNGVRLAEPGEFTRRAFEVGRLDLIQAEAIADIIEAETPRQKALAFRQLDGALGNVARSLHALLVEAAALTEVMIDFSDEGDAPYDTSEQVAELVDKAAAEIGVALGDDAAGEKLRQGLRIVILGAPNAGKSTLFNALVGRDAAIVTDIAGTTRDVLDARGVIAGVPVTFTDTAGLRETEDVVEREGVRRAEVVADAADLRIYLVDGADPVWPEEPTPPVLVLVNKADLAQPPAPPGLSVIRISARTGDGLAVFEQALSGAVSTLVSGAESGVVTRARHRRALQLAQSALYEARDGMAHGLPVEILAECLRRALRAIEALVGRVDADDVLGEIFGRFCVGK